MANGGHPGCRSEYRADLPLSWRADRHAGVADDRGAEQVCQRLPERLALGKPDLAVLHEADACLHVRLEVAPEPHHVVQ